MWRRLIGFGNLLVVLLLLGVLFIMINWIASRRYLRFDLTQQKMTELSDKTLQTLNALDDTVNLVMFYQPNHRLYQLLSDLTKEYARVSPKIKIEFVDPDQDLARAKQLVRVFDIDVTDPNASNLLIVQSKNRHKFLSDTDLADYDYATMTATAEPHVKAFKGEGALTSAIINVTSKEQLLVWFTSGHGEKTLDAKQTAGLAEVKKHLEQQNMRVETSQLLEHTIIPKDVALIVIAGPTRRFTEQEITLLTDYLNNGGRLLALIDPLTDTALEHLFASWGVRLGNDIVVDPERKLPFVSAANLFVTTYTDHPIVKKMKTLMTLYPLARSVRPTETIPEGITVSPLMLTSPGGWGETKTSVSTFERNTDEDLMGPVSIGVAAERKKPVRSRMVVIGDSDFIIDAQLNNVGNRDLLDGSVYWLIEQEKLIGIGPKAIKAVKLTLTAGELKGLQLFYFLAMPLLCGILGVGMWWVRRT